jgi:integrase
MISATPTHRGLAGGADLKTVMDRMGHRQIQTTQKYLHSLPDADEVALAALTRIEGRARRSP